MNTTQQKLIASLTTALALTLAACGGSSGGSSSDNNVPRDGNPSGPAPAFTLIEGNDANRKASALLSLNPGGAGGASNQSLRGGDILQAEPDTDSVLIGALGVDVLMGNTGNDIMIGGTEDFNSSVDGDNLGADNRDRAFGNAGDDVFIWSPGDGSDFFDGGEGIDVLVLGVLGEQRDNNGATEGAPFFNVSPPNRPGSQDFDGIFLDSNNQPVVNVSTSPGFCTVLTPGEYPEEFALLDLDHIVRFSLRAFANDFDAGLREDDDGLRVAISARNVEYLVCTGRETGVEVLDLTTYPPVAVDVSHIPDYARIMIQ